MTTTAEVVARACTGDRDALHIIYRETYPAVTRFVARRVLPDQVEDVVAETYVRALEAMPRYRDRGLPMRAWLTRIALNLVIDQSRSRRSVTVHLADEALERDPVDPAAGWVERHDAATALRRAFATLPSAQRTAVLLRHLDGLPVADTAAVLDISQESVRTLTHRGLVGLRRALADTVTPDPVSSRPAISEEKWT